MATRYAGRWPCKAAGVVFVMSTFAFAVGAAQASLQPNVILIVADDLGYGDVGYLGSPDIKTPSIDSLARQSVVFDAGYATASLCSPSRAGLVTGKYQQRFGHDNNPSDGTDPDIGLPVDQTTMAEVMKSAGYTTAAFGKWHLGTAAKFHPNVRGFDYFFGFLGGAHSYFNEAGIQRNGVPAKLGGKYLTDAITDDAVAFMARTPGQFFLYVAYNAPHTPLSAPQSYLDLYPGLAGTRKVYAAMVTALDKGVGRIVAAADGIDRPTVIVFISDNGAAPGAGGSNKPLKGAKGSTLEGGIRVPFLLRIPGLAPGLYREPVASFDLLPTFAALADAAAPHDIDGVNLLPFLQGGGTPHPTLFWRMNGDRPNAARRGNLKTTESANGVRAWFNLSDRTEKTKASPDPQLLLDYEDWAAGLPSPRW
ncbi:MAG: sulfatase-like hydrolase/transferase [Rhodospirillales bacterium]